MNAGQIGLASVWVTAILRESDLGTHKTACESSVRRIGRVTLARRVACKRLGGAESDARGRYWIPLSR